MAAAPSSKDKAKVLNFCEPQPTVTVYITIPPEPSVQEKVTRKPLPSQATTDVAVGTESVSGPELRKFTIHKQVICYYSPFFSAAFNSNFKEGLSQEMTLDVDLKAFGLFVNWLYTQIVLGANGERPDLDRLAHLWILADRFLVPKLQNQAMDIMYSVLLKDGAPRTEEFVSFCNIADQHEEDNNYFLVLAAEYLTWSRPGQILDINPNSIPVSVFAKSWASLKMLQPLRPGQPAKLVEFHVEEDARE